MTYALPQFEPRTDWHPTPVSELPQWPIHGRVAVDVETKDLRLRKMGCGAQRDGKLVGVAFAIEDGPAHYLPIDHLGGGNLPRETVLSYLRHQSERFKGDLVGANLQYDLDYLAEEDIEYHPRYFRDVQIAAPLLDELQDSYTLDAIAERIGLPGKDETHLRAAADAYGVDPKKGLWQLKAKHVGAYGEGDVRLPLAILRRQERLIEEQDLWPIFNLESRVLPVLLAMKRRGVAVDFDRLDQVRTWAIERELEALAEVKRRTGIALTPADVNKSVALAPVLEHLGVTVPLTPKTRKPSISTDLLKSVNDPSATALVVAKKFNKLRNTFCKSIADHEINGRIHSTFNQLRQTRGDDEKGARFGRLSSCNPNFQQQPARDKEIGPRWRSIFIPDDGGLWCCADYSQQEPRWLVDYAERSKCDGAFQAAERYRNDPSTDSHTMMAEMVFPEDFRAVHLASEESHITKAAKRMRDQAKQIFLALCYGMGAVKLCRSLGLPTTVKYLRRLRKECEVPGPEGRALFDRFDEKAPFVREMAKRVEMRAQQRGYIVTAGGRRCRFPMKLKERGYDWTYKALNRLIQGTSADQMKTAMVDADAAGFRLQLQVHDEVDLTIAADGEGLELAEIMRNSMETHIPVKVDVEIGPSWGEIKEITA